MVSISSSFGSGFSSIIQLRQASNSVPATQASIMWTLSSWVSARRSFASARIKKVFIMRIIFGLSVEDGWNHVVDDLVTLHDITAEQYPGVKYVMFGHSMGSFLVRTYIVDHPDKYDMAIISGTGHQGKLLVGAGNLMAKNIIKKKGYDSDGTKLNDLSMGGYLKKIDDPRTPCDWLSRDAAQVDKYMADELCGFTAKAGLYGDMLKGVKYVTDMANIAKVKPDKPVYFMSGSADPVGDYGKGVKKAYTCFQKAGVKDLSLKLYEGGRHEMLNETNKDQVYQDILTWLYQRV